MIRVHRVAGAALLVTIDRPERRNAVDLETLVALRAAIDEAAGAAARVLVLTGAGARVLRRAPT